MPFGQRKKVVEKSRSRNKRGKADAKSPEVCAGMQVCLRSTPIYHIGGYSHLGTRTPIFSRSALSRSGTANIFLI